MDAAQEKILLQKAQEGDYRSFEVLYEDVYKDMYSYTKKYCQDIEIVKKIIVETVLYGFINISECQNGFRNWIFIILYRKIQEFQGKGYV